jgi:hypothetical protein
MKMGFGLRRIYPLGRHEANNNAKGIDALDVSKMPFVTLPHVRLCKMVSFFGQGKRWSTKDAMEGGNHVFN